MEKELVKQEFIKKGDVILQENEFFGDLNKIMENEMFKTFYDKYFNDYTDIKVILMYMKLYENIKEEYYNKNGINIETELLVFLMKELMINNKSRKKIINKFNNLLEGNIKKDKLSITNIIQENNNENNFIEWTDK